MSAPRQSGHRQEAAASGTGSMAGRSWHQQPPDRPPVPQPKAVPHSGQVRFGVVWLAASRSRTACRSGEVMPDQRLISSRVRRQPVQVPVVASAWQRPMQGEAGRDMARGGGEQRGAHCSGQAGGYPSACAFRGSGRQVFQRQPQAERHETDAHQVTDQHDGRHAVRLLPVMLGHQEIEDCRRQGAKEVDNAGQHR